MSIEKTDEWLTVRDAAARLGITPDQIRSWVFQGLARSRIAETRNGSLALRVSVSDLKSISEGREVTKREEAKRARIPEPTEITPDDIQRTISARLEQIQRSLLEQVRSWTALDVRVETEFGTIRKASESIAAQFSEIQAVLEELRARIEALETGPKAKPHTSSKN